VSCASQIVQPREPSVIVLVVEDASITLPTMKSRACLEGTFAIVAHVRPARHTLKGGQRAARPTTKRLTTGLRPGLLSILQDARATPVSALVVGQCEIFVCDSRLCLGAMASREDLACASPHGDETPAIPGAGTISRLRLRLR